VNVLEVSVVIWAVSRLSCSTAIILWCSSATVYLCRLVAIVLAGTSFHVIMVTVLTSLGSQDTIVTFIELVAVFAVRKKLQACWWALNSTNTWSCCASCCSILGLLCSTTLTRGALSGTKDNVTFFLSRVKQVAGSLLSKPLPVLALVLVQLAECLTSCGVRSIQVTFCDPTPEIAVFMLLDFTGVFLWAHAFSRRGLVEGSHSHITMS